MQNEKRVQEEGYKIMIKNICTGINIAALFQKVSAIYRKT